MSKKRLTHRQQAHIAEARDWYAGLLAGQGNPLNYVPFIREELEAAGVDASFLDPTGAQSVEEIQNILKAAYARGEEVVAEAWRRAEALEKQGLVSQPVPKLDPQSLRFNSLINQINRCAGEGAHPPPAPPPRTPLLFRQ